MPIPKSVLLIISLSLLAALTSILPAHADDWLPLSPGELKMTGEPKAPGAPAIYLYRQVDRDDNIPRERDYARIKILTEEGRKYADVEIPFVKGAEKVRDIQARTIHPDGSVIDFGGQVYEKTIVKAKGVKYLAKTFTMPDVQVGSIIEYRFQEDLDVFASNWILSANLFTKRAKFSLKPFERYALRMNWPAGLPTGTHPPLNEGGVIRMETQDVPAFQVEDYMPPAYEMQSRVDFIYLINPTPETDPDKFWKSIGKAWYVEFSQFADKRKAMEQAVATIVQPTDTPEIKLRKIYARTQQIRNFSFERQKSEQEWKRENLKDIHNVEDVWKRGYASYWHINWLFVALVRAAGLQADPVDVSSRNIYFFNPKMMNTRELNSIVVLVKLDGKDLYLDPGTAFTPFGLLTWSETNVRGLRLNKDGGDWITTTMPAPSESHVDRRATLHLTESGALEGTVTVTFTGLEALWRRIEERNADDTERKRFLEDEIKQYTPTTIEAELTNKPEWSSSDPTLLAEYDLKIPNWASAAGHRTILSVGLFGGMEKHTFEHTERVHPVYFSFPYENDDDVTIELPPGWQVGDMPKTQNFDLKSAAYNLTAENNKGALHIKRQLTINLQTVDVKNYSVLRGFFQKIRTADEQQMVVSPGTAAAASN
jgi:Domain of Unknown Function with PDB structure (DUF3857)